MDESRVLKGREKEGERGRRRGEETPFSFLLFYFLFLSLKNENVINYTITTTSSHCAASGGDAYVKRINFYQSNFFTIFSILSYTTL